MLQPYVLLKQRTDEWFAARATCDVTASRVADALGCGYNSRQRYWRELNGLCGKPSVFQAAVDHGRDTEAWALGYLRAWMRDWVIAETGFWRLPGDTRYGGSPDAVAVTPENDVVAVEIKCPYKIDSAGEKHLRPRLGHIVQLLCQMQLVSAHWGLLFYYTHENGVQAYCVPRQPELWRYIKQTVDLFLVQTEPPKRGPPVLKLDDVLVLPFY